MKCPHCLESFHDEFYDVEIPYRGSRLVERVPKSEPQTSWLARTRVCPACGQAIITLLAQPWSYLRGNYVDEMQVWPKGISRAALPADVPAPFAKDYREACNTLADSPRASAAMSRFCLQRLLRERANVKPDDLSKEIDQVLGALPSDLAEDLDAIRAIGNFGTHPIKSKNTGQIVDVEPGEAEHLLTVLEELLDFYFVRPAARAAKRAEINKKLSDAGKPPLKTPKP